jgi:type IV fimbrial biogenesis protein FimT
MIMLTRSIGFTQLELLITISILAILAGLAIPSFRATLERNEVIAVAEAVSADLRWARSEALKRGVDIKVTFAPSLTGNWQYVIATNPAAPAVPEPLKPVVNSGQIAEFANVKMPNDFNATNIAIFDAVRGTVKGNGTASFTSYPQNTYTLQVVLSVLGRVSVCSVPDKWGGYLKCP